MHSLAAPQASDNAIIIATISSIVSTIIVALIAWMVRTVTKGVSKFWDEHRWLMKQTKENTDTLLEQQSDIKRILVHIEEATS